MSDKPRTHFSFSDLDKIDNPEPFVYTTKDSKRVVFPDVQALGFEEAEEFQADMSQSANNAEALRKWLSEEDFEKLRADKLTLRQINALSTAVGEYYGGTFGDQGEGTASAS